ncbi:hypothetical protein GCK72_001056 [Caenorhabditis remanei]|uniref:Uncharacterized protein n=3 Tax=Caenorhabditis TaxID=6237 RepID=E3LY45_CAERE|nr:hypothetical protein GCK72_001056 [Caenorhabditis remanei]EFO84640.1 hypothetical protein CRE_03972 [Caenorhabditis remanei]KAF1769241.1 hypothetical protein GCK72_001056 [Caenorhabditis remanei]
MVKSTPIQRFEFAEKICNRDLRGYVLYSTESAWIWVGESKIESIGLAHFPNFTMLVDGENTQREFIKSITLRLTKTSRFTQVFFTTDIECEEGMFWKVLNDNMLEKLNALHSNQ